VKNISVLGLLFISSALFASPKYSLQEICTKYGTFNQCSTVPFCQQINVQPGCYLAKGAPSYVEALCKTQTQQQGCAIMQQQGNCVWIEESGSICKAKVDSL
jgi:hypothetical protein